MIEINWDEAEVWEEGSLVEVNDGSTIADEELLEGDIYHDDEESV